MKIIVDRDFRNINSSPEWITIDVPKEKWKKFGSKSSYLENQYSSNWRIVFGGKSQILSESVVLTLLKKSLTDYFLTNDEIIKLTNEIQLSQNFTFKRKEKQDEISMFSLDIEVMAFKEWLSSQNYEVEKNQLEDFILSHPEFFYIIPFIDPNQILRLDDRKQLWDSNSIESFMRNNLLIQVKFSSLSSEEYRIGLFLRKDLKLGKGKSGAQLSHGIISLLYQPKFRSPIVDNFIKKYQDMSLDNHEIIQLFTVSDLKDLEDIEWLCLQNKVNNSLIIDAGHTQIAPGTATCIGVGPIPKIWLDILAFNIEAVELK